MAEACVELINENGGGPGGAATEATPEEELGGWEKRRCRHPYGSAISRARSIN